MTTGNAQYQVPVCEWYALCTNEAVGTVHHPILCDVPVCQRCADKHGLAVAPYIGTPLILWRPPRRRPTSQGDKP